MLHEEQIVMKVSQEVTKGTAVAGATAVYAENINIRPTGSFKARNGTKRYMGHGDVVGKYVGQMGELTFDVELRTDNEVATGLDAGFEALLPGLGLYNSSGEIFDITSVFTNHKTLTFTVWEGATSGNAAVKQLHGAMGNAVIEPEEPGGRILMRCTFYGIYTEETDAALPAISYDNGQPLLAESMTVTRGGAAKDISTFSLDLGNNIVPRYSLRSAGGILHYVKTNHLPTLKMDLEMDLAANDAVYAALRAGTSYAVSLVATDGVGTVTLTLPVWQYSEAVPGARDGIKIWDLTGILRNTDNTAEDSVKITTAAV